MGIAIIAISGKRTAAGVTGRRTAVRGSSNTLTDVINVRTFGGHDGGLWVEGTIEGQPCRMLLYTCASVSVVKKSILQSVDKFEQLLGNTQLQTATGNVTHIFGRGEVSVGIDYFENFQQMLMALISTCTKNDKVPPQT